MASYKDAFSEINCAEIRTRLIGYAHLTNIAQTSQKIRGAMGAQLFAAQPKPNGEAAETFNAYAEFHSGISANGLNLKRYVIELEPNGSDLNVVLRFFNVPEFIIGQFGMALIAGLKTGLEIERGKRLKFSPIGLEYQKLDPLAWKGQNIRKVEIQTLSPILQKRKDPSQRKSLNFASLLENTYLRSYALADLIPPRHVYDKLCEQLREINIGDLETGVMGVWRSGRNNASKSKRHDHVVYGRFLIEDATPDIVHLMQIAQRLHLGASSTFGYGHIACEYHE